MPPIRDVLYQILAVFQGKKRKQGKRDEARGTSKKGMLLGPEAKEK